MTTNALDLRGLVIASDSRWSFLAGPDEFFFVDDVGFDKIVCRPIVSMICAGDAELIEAWRNWFSQPVLDVDSLPATERNVGSGVQDVTITLVRSMSGSVVYRTDGYLQLEDYAYFSGSGAQHALDCFAVNRCSKKSVETAGGVDHQTGGRTMYVELDTNTHNLNVDRWVTLGDLKAEFAKRGFVMSMTTKKVTPISEYAGPNKDQVAKILRGDFSLSAPTGRAPRAWTPKERDELRDAFKAIADEEAELRKKK